MNYLLDTCVISELIKPRPNGKVLAWIDSVPAAQLYLSAVTVGEIQKGISRLGKSRRAAEYQQWLDEDLRRQFDNRIIDVTQDIARTWGYLSAVEESQGTPKPILDTLIAATAFVNKMTLVTRNAADIPSGVQFFNPFE